MVFTEPKALLLVVDSSCSFDGRFGAVCPSKKTLQLCSSIFCALQNNYCMKPFTPVFFMQAIP